MKPKAFFVVSQWNNDVSWVEEFTDDYVIYDKSNTLPEGEKVIKVPNIGYNLHDIFHFIVNHYYNLPEVIAFLEGNPFDHCNREKFDKIIYNETLTPIESYEHLPSHQKDSDGGFIEINNNWYISAHNSTYNQSCKWPTFDSFMNLIFSDYVRPSYIRFAPGGQYIVEKKRLIHYNINFWNFLLKEISIEGVSMPTEGHIMERALYTIFQNTFTARD